jgi:predicted porin
VKFNSQLSLNLDITIRNTKSESINSGTKSVDAQRSDMTFEPRMTYQFSKAITGGIRGRWNDSNDKIQKRKHHIRELGITAEIRF